MNLAPTVCTIIAKNYVSSARVLAKSFQRHHPTGTCYVLIIDDFRGFIDPEQEPFRVLTLADLQIPDVRNICFRYEVVELATAVKPHLLDYLLTANPRDPILYLDPDVYITRPLDDLYAHFEKGDILLTPHTYEDYPDDGLRPSDRCVFLYGLFNLGFIGLKDKTSSHEFLDWWKRKLAKNCTNNPAAGYFVDQRFIDFASILFQNIQVIREPGYNVAPWNLHCRQVARSTNGWYCNGAPLYFFHFSGYNPLRPDQSYGSRTRSQFVQLTGVDELSREYRQLLLSHGFSESRVWPYTYDFFASGRKISPGVRKLYRNTAGIDAQCGDPFKSNLLRWLALCADVIRAARACSRCVGRALGHDRWIRLLSSRVEAAEAVRYG